MFTNNLTCIKVLTILMIIGLALWGVIIAIIILAVIIARAM